MKKIYILFSVFIIATFFIAGNTVTAQSTNIIGPVGSSQFGSTVIVLTNGNYVVTDPGYDDGAILNVGAVYLYNGSTHALISTLKGSKADDNIGSHGVTMLSNGNYVVNSAWWDNGTAIDAGAVTFGSATTGINGVVSNSNSLVSGASDAYVGSVPVTILGNGNYVVNTREWDNGPVINAGAVTFGSGTTGISGMISSSNSLVGSKANDVGNSPIIVLSNGNYVVRSPLWDNGALIDAGAVTFGSGTTGISGVVSSVNSLVGGTVNNLVGNGGVIVLSNGNYIVRSQNWDNGAATDAGAVTFGNGTTGISGVVSSINSLVGSTANNLVGGNGVTVLSNSNYVVKSPSWDNGAAADAGAVTFGNGTTGVNGVLGIINSLVGSKTADNIGIFGITALNNGNYVVRSPDWDNGAATDAGAVTFGSGTTGVKGVVSSINSLVGSTANNTVGNYEITVLSNGSYVVRSPNWDNGAILDVGAVTFGSGTTGITGVVSSSNSLVGGSTANNLVGYSGVTALSNGNYVVNSEVWDNGAVNNAGAVTFCSGTTGLSGLITISNSLVGGTANNFVGLGGTIALSNGNYVVISYYWDNGAASDAGAVTFGNGTTGVSGVVSSTNSLVGSMASDLVGNRGITALSNGNYIVNIADWDNGAVTNVGAVTFGNGTTGVSGTVNVSNSLIGSTSNEYVGGIGITALSNGSYLVISNGYDNGAATNVGAVTFGNATTGISGVVNNNNSLVGSTANDFIGESGITLLSNGNYLVSTPNWDNGAVLDAGAVTFGSSTTGVSGMVSSINSLVGSANSDKVGVVTALGNANYLVRSNLWDNGAVTNAGAISWGNSSSGVSGTITTCNSVLGTTANGGGSMVFSYNSTYDYLIVGRPSDNIVTIYNASGMPLANTLDATAVNINGTNTVPLIANTGCRIIATLTPNGASPVSGTVNAKAWIETAVPTHAGYPFVARHYEITPTTNTSSATAKVTLYFTQQEFNDFNAHPTNGLDLPTDASDAIGKANLRIGKYAGTSSDGSGLPATYSSTAQVINPIDTDIIWNNSLSRWEVSFNVTGFSGFIVQTYTFVLPLSLLEFNGRLQNNNGLLNWKTTNELNAHSFDIERSTDGRTYTKIGNAVAYNTAGDHQYNFTDNNINFLSAPVVYYRLKQKEIDGRFTYSSIVALTIDDSKSIVLLYPNPVIAKANLTITVNKPQQVQARITDNTGRLLKQMQWDIAVGSTALQVDLKGLASGMYYLQLTGETMNERKIFIKQ